MIVTSFALVILSAAAVVWEKGVASLVSVMLITKYYWNCDSKDDNIGRECSRHGSNEIGIINYVMKIWRKETSWKTH
jgi:hypothetical protein